jgi:hypothetical protein
MLGLTSIELPFLGCPGLDLGSVMLYHITYITPVMVMLILLVWRIGFEVTGMEFLGVMPTVQGLSDAMPEACG